MKADDLLEHLVLSDEVAIAPVESGFSLNVAGVYQDSVTRDRAVQTCRRATRIAGEERVQSAWYNVSCLSDPGMLVDAVRAALAADVIIVSVHAADELPPSLYNWIEAWLSRRVPAGGCAGGFDWRR